MKQTRKQKRRKEGEKKEEELHQPHSGSLDIPLRVRPAKKKSSIHQRINLKVNVG